MRTLSLLLAAAPLAFVLGCPNGTEEPPKSNVLDERAAPLPAPKHGIALHMPKAEQIAAGGDQIWCWVPELPAGTFDTDKLAVHADGAQGGGGHHLFVFMSAIPRKPGDVFDCTQVEAMATLRPLIAPLTPTSPTFGKVLPEGYAIRIPAGAQLVVQSHYVNVKDQPILIQDNVNIELAPDGANVPEAAYWTETSTDFSIPTGEQKLTATCTVQGGDLQVLSMIGHMHEWGKKFTFARSTDTTPLYSVDQWTAQYRDSPPLTQYPANQPLVLHDGDKLTMTCEWNNDTGKPLEFPFEMCTAFGAYAPARPDGFVLCDPSGSGETVTPGL